MKEVSIDTRMVVSVLSKSIYLLHLASKLPCSSISFGLVLASTLHSVACTFGSASVRSTLAAVESH